MESRRPIADTARALRAVADLAAAGAPAGADPLAEILGEGADMVDGLWLLVQMLEAEVDRLAGENAALRADALGSLG